MIEGDTVEAQSKRGEELCPTDLNGRRVLDYSFSLL